MGVAAAVTLVVVLVVELGGERGHASPWSLVGAAATRRGRAATRAAEKSMVEDVSSGWCVRSCVV